MHRTQDNRRGLLALSGAIATVLGCSSGGGDNLPTGAPTTLERIADEGFQDAGAVAVSPDGETFFVAAYDEALKPGIFAIDVPSKSVSALHVGEPLLYPSDVATSCDGETLFIADMGLSAAGVELGADEKEEAMPRAGGIYTLAADGGTPVKLDSAGIGRAAGVVVSVDCDTLYIGGFTDTGTPAVFKLAPAGGSASVLYEGAPLVSPSGIHVDADEIVWLTDHLARGDEGEGLLFAINPAGEVSPVLSGLGLGRIGGVSLVPGGTTAVIPASDGDDKKAFLLTANTTTGAQQVVDAPDLQYPTGVAAARNAPVMAVATESAVYSATFE